MGQTPAISHDLETLPADIRRRAVRLVGHDRLHSRSRRVVALLLLIWIVGMFDLAFTLLAKDIGGFVEVNPLAVRIMHVNWLVVAFKLAMLTVASAIFLKYRRRWLTEFGCWSMCLVHTVLAFVWLMYYATSY